MIISSTEKVPLEKCPALVLNADFRPLSYYPLSLWCWQDAVKSVFLNRVSIVSSYQRKVRSPSFEMKLPSVIALKSFIITFNKLIYLRIIYSITILMLLYNFFWILKNHPHQYVYFNFLAGKNLNEKFDKLILMDGDAEDRPEEIVDLIKKILTQKIDR